MVDRLETSIRAMPVQRRMSMLIALCAGLTALLCMLAVVGTGWWLQQNHVHDDVEEVGRTLAYALQAPVAFNDAKGMADAMSLLRARPEVSGAWVYDAQGRLLNAIGNGAALPPGAHGGGLFEGQLVESAAIVVDGQTIGTVVIVNQLSHLWRGILIAVLAIGLGSALGFAASVLLARRIARAITEPISTLAAASRAVAASHDYTLRLPEAGDDEIGTAIGAYNAMLDEIRTRGQALQEANRHLEARVAERTAELERERDRAEAASTAKTRFLANMSHELRTPLNAVIGAAQLLQEGHDDVEAQAHLVASIRQSGTSLLGLIENVLDLSRIEIGALELDAEDFNLVDCVEAAIATASVSARAKGLELACIIDPSLPAWRHGDALRLRQVLLNLLANAVKFTLQGEVTLRVAPGPDPLDLRIAVRDTGIGIGRASLEQVFEPFRQADDASNRRFGGSGLGLTISRQLVQAMGGRIEVHSTLGEGTRFDIELALPLASQAPAAAPSLHQSVVYFEPHEASAEALAAQLARLGCKAQRCRTPRELRLWMSEHAADPDKPWLLAAVDAPETWAFLEESIAWLDPERVIGMTMTESHAAEVARERFQVPRNVIKPVLRSALVSRLGAVVRQAGRAPMAVPMTQAEADNVKHVLVVEDDPLNQTIVCSMLARAGYRTSVAADGGQALSVLGRQAFDVVLMDWQMPDMDGLEITRRLRAGACGRFGKLVPIIALTANAFAEDRAACLAAGMNDFLTKPVLAASLTAAIARWTATPLRAEDLASPSLFTPLV